MKRAFIFGAALSLCLIASSCAVKKAALSRPVSSVPSEFSSAISSVSSGPAVSSMIAVSFATNSAADKTSASSAAVSGIVSSTAGKKSSIFRQKVAKAASKSTVRNGNSFSKSTTIQINNGPPINNSVPHYVLYQNRIYLTPGPFSSDSYKNPANPGNLIAHCLWITAKNICAIQGVDPAKAICVQDDASKTGYSIFRYLCNEPAVIAGRSYQFINSNAALNLDFAQSASTVSSPQSDEYLLRLNPYTYKSPTTCMNPVLGPEIGKIPGGTVYVFDKIDPSEAIIIHSGSLWMTAVKRYGYTGKTIDEVWEEKTGIPNAVLY